MKQKILTIDDDENLLKTLGIALQSEGWEVFGARDGVEGLQVAFNIHPDLVLLDVVMPKIDGLDTLRRLREMSDVPIIMLTARSETPDIVKGLEAGADDYVRKPFDVKELVARIRACLRHRSSSGAVGKASVLVCGELTIDLARHRVMVNGASVDLTPTEFALLSYLARNYGQVIPHRAILREVWGPEYIDQMDYLHLYIRYLRQKIEADPAHPEIIKTERGVGYSLGGD